MRPAIHNGQEKDLAKTREKTVLGENERLGLPSLFRIQGIKFFVNIYSDDNEKI